MRNCGSSARGFSASSKNELLCNMIRFLKELYLMGFTFFYRASNKSWSHTTNAGKGAAGVSLFLSIILVTISMWIGVFMGKHIFLVISQLEAWIASFAIFCVNYYVLVIRGHGIKFEREFNHLKKSKQTFLQISCVATQLTSVALFLYSANVYQHFFYIVPK
jgi:hypothetical protein